MKKEKIKKIKERLKKESQTPLQSKGGRGYSTLSSPLSLRAVASSPSAITLPSSS